MKVKTSAYQDSPHIRIRRKTTRKTKAEVKKKEAI